LLLLLIIIKSEQKYTAYFTAQSDILVVAAISLHSLTF